VPIFPPVTIDVSKISQASKEALKTKVLAE
jgi:hypothetical protein